MKKRKPVKAQLGSAIWILGGFLAVWLIIMMAVTWITAHVLNERMSMESRETIQNLIYSTRVYDWTTRDYDVEQDTKEFWLFEGLRSFGRRNNRISGGLLRDVQHPAQTACVVFDGDGNLLEKNGNGLYFWYMTEENWHMADSDAYEDGVARVLYDQSEISELALEVLQKSDVAALRLTGVIDNGFLTPSKIEFITSRAFYDAVFRDGRTGSYEKHKLIQEMVDSGTLEWQTFLASSFEDENEQVYYSVRCYASMYDAGDPITVDGTVYADLMSYMEQIGDDEEPGIFWVSDMGNLWDRLICRETEVYRDGDYELGLEYRILAAVRFSPMKLAMDGLLYVYIGSLFLALLSALVIWSVLKKRLIIPIRAINEAMEKGWKIPLYGSYYTSHWREVEELDQQYSRTRREMERLQDENNRLNVALNYAKEAESNRRQMTSAIAHELKTPLAVIHSYTEGLKEHIAEEKRDRYLEVILSETERLDGLVMEMLDLSRLEAGKVKLTRDPCNISEMASAVFDRLALAAADKNVTLRFDLQDGCIAAADESRLTQVIENFASNAVRYTPDHGEIRVKTYADCRFVWFRVENTCRPISDKELERIWDTFFQTDKARSGKGTGLGLAIAKNIIDLHGGTCRAENISDGVAFWFRLQK